MSALSLTDIQHAPLAISAVDAAGNPAVFPAGAVTWTSSAPTIATVTPSADGLTADVAAVGPLGAAQVLVSVVVDPTLPPLTGTLDVTVTASAAATIQVTAGAPVAK